MLDLYVYFFVMLVSIFVIFLMLLVLIYKNHMILKKVKQKDEELYFKICGIKRDGVFGFTEINNFIFWKWVFEKNADKDANIAEMKKGIRSFLFLFLIPISLILFCSFYIIVKYQILPNW